jgi:hypothetical protein
LFRGLYKFKLVLKFLGCLVEIKIKIKILLALMTTLTNSKDCPEAASKLVDFLKCPSLLGSGKIFKNVDEI